MQQLTYNRKTLLSQAADAMKNHIRTERRHSRCIVLPLLVNQKLRQNRNIHL